MAAVISSTPFHATEPGPALAMPAPRDRRLGHASCSKVCRPVIKFQEIAPISAAKMTFGDRILECCRRILMPGAAARGSAAASNRRRGCAGIGRRLPGLRAKQADRHAATQCDLGSHEFDLLAKVRQIVVLLRGAGTKANAATSRNAPLVKKNLAMAPGIRLRRGLQIIRDEVVSDLAAHQFTYFERITEVNAAPDTHLFLLFVHLTEAGEIGATARVGNVGRGKAYGPITDSKIPLTAPALILAWDGYSGCIGMALRGRLVWSVARAAPAQAGEAAVLPFQDGCKQAPPFWRAGLGRELINAEP